MSVPYGERPDLPEQMTWEELELLPDDIAAQIELWEGRVVWVRRGPLEHQVFTMRLTSALEQAARKDMSTHPERCWRVALETNVFLGVAGKTDFVTPDFLVVRCLPSPYQDVRGADVVLAGEVLSPANRQVDIESKKARYASAGIPWYWEVALSRTVSAIETVRAYVLETHPGELPPGVRPLRSANYLLAGEWTPADEHGVEIDFPFPVRIPWTDLTF
ncbi:Uma2 family endonuclease [Nocardia asteroides]|uniref:Uma2 family endonuclease n=1 Tax=Nocardia asteroides TaxID=1824 RepID=UPI00344334E3